MIAFTVRERTHEVGIRLALGGRPRDIVTTLGLQAGQPVILGLLLGLGGVAYASRFLAGILYGVAATDPLTYVVVAVGLSLVALFACYLPARRATDVDPLVALRDE